MSVKDLPSYIHVANFKDIFWNNNSDLYPNNAPNINLYKQINKVRPVFIAPLTGLITLEGEYNHAVYNGKYYKLIKIKLIDIPRKRYEYQLEEDVMMNLLHLGGEVWGILNRTNRKDILKGCLHTTQPILESPAKLTVNLFKEVQSTWQERVDVKNPSADVLFSFIDYYISALNWERSKARWPVNLYVKALTSGKKWDVSKQNRSQKHSINPLFIIDYLKPTQAWSWKHAVWTKIQEFLSDFSDKTVSINSLLTSSHLKGKHCITYKNQAIALGTTTEEQLEVVKIDLSGLTDIRLLGDHGQDVEVYRSGSHLLRDPQINKDLLPPNEEWDNLTEPLGVGEYIKLCRYPYLPFKKQGEEVDDPTKYLNVKHNTYKPLDLTKDLNYTGGSPQNITLKNDISVKGSRRGWLWHINRLDFATIEGWKDNYKNDQMIDPFRELSYFDDGKEWATDKYAGSRYFFRDLDRENIPGLGFLIYQFMNTPGKWDDYEYIGNDEPKTFLYRSGLNKHLISEYQKQDKWWSNLPLELAHINGVEELSSFILDIDQFRWLCIAPSIIGYGYKWVSFDYFKHNTFFKGRETDSNGEYITTVLNWDINRNNEVFKSVVNKNFIYEYLIRRAQKIDSISIYSPVEFPNKIKKNDIFCSDLEYRWKNTPFAIAEIPVDGIDMELLEQIGKWMPTAAAVTSGTLGTVGLGGASKASMTIMRTGLRSLPKVLAGYGRLIRKSPLKGAIILSKTLKDVGSAIGEGAAIGVNVTAKEIWKGMRTFRNIKATRTALQGVTLPFKVVKGVFTAARTAAAIKTLGLILIGELIFWGVEEAINANKADYSNRLKNSIWTMGDFFGGDEVEGIKQEFDKSFVLYLHKGLIKYGLFREYERLLKLSDHEAQILENVEGTTTRPTKFWHIEYLGQLSNVNAKLTDEQELSLFRTIYKAIRNSPDGKIINLTTTDLEDINLVATFDLVGTNWLAQFYKGKVHLISKNVNAENSGFSNIEGVSNRELEFEEGQKPSIYAQINQKSDLVIYSTVLPLNTKFTFDPEIEKTKTQILQIRGLKKELIAYQQSTDYCEKGKPQNSESLSSTGGDTDPRDYYHVRYETDYDFIDTYISVYKKIGFEPTPINIAEYERLKLQHQKADFDYWVDSEVSRNQLFDRKVKTARQIEDLDSRYNVTGDVISAAGAKAVQGAIYGGLAGGIKGAVGGFVAGGLGTLGSQFIKKLWGAREYETLKGRVTEDEQAFIRDNSLQEFSRKQNYEFKKSELIIALNSLTNTYIKPSTKDDDIQRIMNCIKGWDNQHIKIYLPTKKQEEEITAIYDEFGCNCRSTHFLDTPLIIRNGMVSGLYQFSNLDHTSILSKYTTDLIINEIVRNIFITGTKFIDFKHTPLQEETFTFIVPKGTQIDFDTSNMEDWDDRLWDRFVVTKPKDEILKILKNQQRFGLTEAEYEANKERLEGVDDDELLKNINEIITHRQTGSTHFVLPPSPIDPHEAEKQILTKQIEDKQKELDKCKEELQKCEQEKLETEGKLRAGYEILNEVKKKLEQDLAEKTTQYNDLKNKYDTDISSHETGSKIMADVKKELEKKITDLTEDLRQCNIKRINIENAKNTCDLINTRKIKELQDKIKQLEADLKVKNVELEAAKAGLVTTTINCDKITAEMAQKVQEIDRISKLLVDKETELKAKEDRLTKGDKDLLEKLKELALKEEVIKAQKSQIDELTKEKADCETRIVEKDKEIETKTRELATCKQQKVGNPYIDIDMCKLLKDINIDSVYEINLKKRDNGFSAFTDLCFELARAFKWMRLMRIEPSLYEIREMSPILRQINELQKIESIDIATKALSHPHWGKFERWLETGGTQNGDINEVVKITNELKDNGSVMPFVHAVKDVMDELNYQCHKAQEELASQIETNQDLDLFFKHVYPGTKTKQLYEALYGVKTEIATAKKKFAESDCGDSDPILTLKGDIDRINHIIPKIDPSSSPLTLGSVSLDGISIYPYIFPINAKTWEKINIYNKYTTWGLTYYYYSSWYKKASWDPNRKYAYGWWNIYYNPQLPERSEETIDYNKVTYSDSGKFYIHADSSISQNNMTYKKIDEVRKRLWKNRKNIELSGTAKDMLKANNLWIPVSVRGQLSMNVEDRIESYHDHSNLNLSKIFGKNAEDAYKLLAILDANKFWIQRDKKPGSDELQKTDNIYLNVLKMRIDENINYYVDPTKRQWIIINNDFSDVYSLLNYILLHLRNPKMELQNPMEGRRSTKTVQEWSDILDNIVQNTKY